MRKTILLFPLLALLFLCSCGIKPAEENKSASNTETYSYPVTDAGAFVVDAETIYIAGENSPTIKAYDRDGNELNSFSLGEGNHTNLCVVGGSLYAFTYGNSFNGISAYNLSTKELTLTHIDSTISSVMAMEVINNNAFLIEWTDSEKYDHEQEAVKYDPEDNYNYMGEKASVIDLSNFEKNDINIKNVIQMKKYNDSSLLYYAYDGEGGFYFTIYDTITKTFSDKIYNNDAGYTFAFAYINDTDSIVYSDFTYQKLTRVSRQPSGVKADLLSNIFVMSGKDLQYSGGELYVLGDTKEVKRFSCAASPEEKTIEFITTKYMKAAYGCGRSIKTSKLSDEEFALTVLSQSSEYDLCMMISSQLFSDNVRKQGAFYPLNDVPSVKEYLNACFPYLKEAATDTDGQIWMLPIAVDMPYFIYEPSNCEKQGVAFGENTSWETLLNKAEELYEKPELRDCYMLNGYNVESAMLVQYNEFYAFNGEMNGYDTVLFRRICSLLKDRYADGAAFHTRLSPMSQYSEDINAYYDRMLFSLESYRPQVLPDEAYTRVRAAKVPSLENEKNTAADVTYFCVNASSANLDETLNYISDYCEYMLTQKDTYLLSDKSKYTHNDTPLAEDLYSIYSNGTASFELSSEIFWNDFVSYIDGDLGVDEMIKEINRKTSMYIKE